MSENAIKYTCNGKRGKDGKRAGCGEDLTKLIAAIPQDGEEHIYRCPRCGNTGSAKKVVPHEEV